jgi:hypothetical protein
MATFKSFNHAMNFRNVMVSKEIYPWVGVNDRGSEGVYVTYDGTVSVNLPWADFQPDNYQENEDCVHLNYFGQGFNDYDCEDKKKVACQTV